MQVCANGPNTPATLQLYVTSSEQFTYSSTCEKSSFFVSDPQYFGGASGQNIRRISVGANSAVQLHGDDMTYNAIVSPHTENPGYFSIRTTSTCDSSMQAIGNTVTVSGMPGLCTISFCRNDGVKSVPVTTTLSDYAEIDLSSANEHAVFAIINSTNNITNQIISNWPNPGDFE